MTGAFDVCESDSQGIPAGLGPDGVSEFGQGGAQSVGVMVAQGRGDAAAALAQRCEGFSGSLLVAGTQVLGGSTGGLGLLGVPVRGGELEEDRHVQDHRGAGTVLAPAECPLWTRSRAARVQVLCVVELCSGVGAGGANFLYGHGRRHGESETARERQELGRSQLFVAMTRSRGTCYGLARSKDWGTEHSPVPPGAGLGRVATTAMDSDTETFASTE
ncbi:hypothetical protein [Streptomyces sp. NPDC093589]|uniref:hypothetical protein n=1 Tax=Streptomyces sp. NPDC093589 TaxID=3366043 RepID=UPI00380C2BA8